MPNLNQVMLIGHVTRDVELRHTNNNVPVTDISLAINEKKKKGNGDVIEETTFVDVTLWNKLAEIAYQYVRKGEAVLICGRLRLETWVKDGEKRSKLKVVANRLQRLTHKSNEGQDND